MGLRVSFTTLTDETIAEAIGSASSVEFLANRFEPLSQSDGWMSSLLSDEPKIKPGRRTQRFFRPGVKANVEGVKVSLDESRDGLHYLLTKARGNVWPANFLVDGGTLLSPPEEERRVRVFQSEEMQKVSELLCKLNHGDLGRHYNADKMTQQAIYPKEIWTREEFDGCQFLLDHFDILRRFFSGATGRELGCQVDLA